MLWGTGAVRDGEVEVWQISVDVHGSEMSSHVGEPFADCQRLRTSAKLALILLDGRVDLDVGVDGVFGVTVILGEHRHGARVLIVSMRCETAEGSERRKLEYGGRIA